MSLKSIQHPSLNPQSGGAVPVSSGLALSSGPSLLAGATPLGVPAVFEAAFAGDGYTITAELYRATLDNQLLEDISSVMVDGSVDLNVDRDIKLACQLVLRDPSVIDPYADYLAPFVRIVYDDGRDPVYQQVGLFATKVPQGRYSPFDAVATFDGADLTSLLATAFYTDSTTNTAGTVLSTAVATTITNGGITRLTIPTAADTLSTDQTFPIGTSRLEKANAYLDQLGWYHLGTELDGRISTPGPALPLEQIEPWRTLTDSDIKSLVEVQPSGLEIANVVLVINDNGAAAPLSSVARNDDPSSPTSTVAIGRSIMRVEKVSGQTTQAALDALAARYLAESRTRYRTARLTILHDPTALVPHQTVRLSLTGTQAGFSGLWWIKQSTMGFTPDKATVLTLGQITDDLNEVRT